MVLAAMGCGLPSFCQAQSYGAAPVVTLPPEAGGFGGAYASPSFGDSDYAAPAGYGAACPPQGGPPTDCPPQPASHWPWKCRPLFISPKLLEPPRGTYLRLEYLLWEIEKPGKERLGADRIADPTLTQPFAPATDNTTSDGFPLLGGGFGYAPIIDELQLRDNDGFRITAGVPLKNYGTLEASFWILEQASDHYEWIPRELFPGIEFNPTTSVTVDGVIGSDVANTGPFRVYDTLEVDYESDMWGADARYVVDALSPPGEGLKFRPVFGFKYVGLQEAMHQKGQFESLATPPFSTTIDSDTDNTLLGGTVGLRTELDHRWFVLGIEPAVTFAGNIAQASVVTERFASPDEPRTEVDADYFTFSPILDLKTYARIKCSDNLSLHVGYDAFWLSRVFRPARVIDYNVATDASGGLASDFKVREEDDHVAVEGLSVGAEFIF